MLKKADRAAAEKARLEAVDALKLLDTSPEERFDRITRIARQIFNVPVAEINLLDEFRQYTHSPQVPGESAASDRFDSFCHVAIESDEILVVSDATQDERFAAKGGVTGPRNIRFYAGRPLSIDGESRVGTLCLVDTQPRDLDDVQLRLLDDIGMWVERELRDSPGRLDAQEEPAGAGTALAEPALPPGEPVPAYAISGTSLPMRKVGGDFFAVRELDGGVELLVADVMGQGAAAEAIASTIRSRFEQYDGSDIAAAMQDANGTLSQDLRSVGTFATLVLARVDSKTGIVDYADAGHGLTIIVRADRGIERLESTGFPLGLLAAGAWDVRSSMLEPGDTLVSFTDGLLNLFDGTLASLTQIAELVRETSGPQALINRVSAMNRRSKARDDLTVVAVTRTA
ncbi:GAF domain-containing protein [Glaciihabitans tibetensis]|uniref:GAF domain-containing protein n=1 Tax=Glaciihabitans tibetensis TaxID=1266600 RepID=A0A2T0V797_9MICO|nr:GAF domain-containing SpoIIE family protein phosphatase [Glaciihabitans tibetensis]PRY65928.1 GAF domain-containing protein [Glaciihabitans tibetensis]